MEIKFREHINEHVIFIDGAIFPHHPFDPLAKIWSSIRKVCCRKYGVDVVGTFTYDDDKAQVACNFFLNYSIVEAGSIGEETYLGMFKDNFPFMMELFEDTIITFMSFRTNGYADYLALSEMGATDDELRASINGFLESVGLRSHKKGKNHPGKWLD